MKAGQVVLAAGVAAFLLSGKKKKSSKPESKENVDPDRGTDLPSILEPVPEGPVPPGKYAASEGETIVLEVGMESTGSIGGMVSEHDGKFTDDIYTPLKSGFEVNYQSDGAHIKFIRPGKYKLAALTLEGEKPIWEFEVKE